MLDHPIGTSDMVAWYNEDAKGTRHSPLGKGDTGLISYTGDGHVFVSLSAEARAPFGLNDPFGGTLAEHTAAMTSHITYSGHFDREGDDVIHGVLHASCSQWIGTEQRWHVHFGGSETLTPSASGAVFNGRKVTAHVQWRRADAG